MKRKYHIPLQWELKKDWDVEYDPNVNSYFYTKIESYKFTLYFFGIPVFYLCGKKYDKIHA